MNTFIFTKANRSYFNTFVTWLIGVLIVGLLVVPVQVFAAAGSPLIINHQGRLLDSAGNLLGGSGTNFCFRFAIFDDPTAGVQVWPASTPSTMTVSVKNGVFNVGLGDTSASGDAFTAALNFQTDTYYLQPYVANSSAGSCASVTSFETFTTRQRILATGYAMNARGVVANVASTATGAGDTVTVTAGAGGSTSGTGGAVDINAGAATGTNSDGGGVTIDAGVATGTGSAQAVPGGQAHLCFRYHHG
jgi:hypothetical protein